MRKLFRIPFFSVAAKFCSRILMGSLWGLFLSPFSMDIKLLFGALMAGMAVLLGTSFYAWDRMPVTASRISLYGLLLAGEALCTGSIAFATLGAFTGQLHVHALWICALGGSLLTLYSISVLYRDNMSKRPGSTT